MEDIFSQFGDIFGGHFSGGGFRSSSSSGGGRRVNRGSDIRIKVRLTLAEIANGVTKKLKINKTIACDKCGGTGAKDSNSYSTCSTCNGTGYVTRVENTFFGRMQTQSVCPTCGGTGKVITSKCDKCGGEGVVRGDRTGTGTKGVFGHQMRFDLAEGFPLLTTKKVFLKGVIHELLWFLAGDTNIKYLLDHGVHIWDNDAYRYYNELCVRHGVLPLEREAFLDAVRREEPSSIEGYGLGDLNHVYGYQWRSWPRPDGGCIDQIRQVIDQIKHSPDSRRMLVSAWNVAEVDDMALPPCHVLFQFYVAGGRLSCQLYQRSADTFLGVPFNIASYALLTMMIAQECGLRPGDFVHMLGDAHLYLNHADQVAEQLSRTPRPLPTLRLNPAVRSVFDFRYEDFTLENYDPWPAIKAPMSF